MKVFVSTKETQGQRENDFCFVPEGEIVTYPVMTCTNERADDRCGCNRSMCGILAHGATTTMKVADLEGNVLTLRRIIRASLVNAGWPVDDSDASSIASELLSEAQQFPTGTVVEYRDGKFAARNVVTA